MDWLVRTIQIHLAAACEPEPIRWARSHAAGRRSGGPGGGPEPTEVLAAEQVEDRARRDGGAAAPVVDRSRRGYTLRSRWRAGPTQRRHPVVDQGPADIKPAAGVMDRRWSGQSQSSVSGSRGLRIAGLQQPAGPRHSPAPTGVGRGTSDGQDCTTMGTTTSRIERASDQDVPLLEF